MTDKASTPPIISLSLPEWRRQASEDDRFSKGVECGARKQWRNEFGSVPVRLRSYGVPIPSQES